MDELQAHMLKELYWSTCDPANAERLEVQVAKLRERVTGLEARFAVAAAMFTALASMAGLAVGVFMRWIGG